MDNQEFIYLNQKTILLPKDVLFIEADINYTRFTLVNGRNLIATVTMKEVEKLLVDYNFIRIHKSYMVNRSCILSIKTHKKQTSVCLTNNIEVSVSRRKKSFVRKSIQ